MTNTDYAALVARLEAPLTDGMTAYKLQRDAAEAIKALQRENARLASNIKMEGCEIISGPHETHHEDGSVTVGYDCRLTSDSPIGGEVEMCPHSVSVAEYCALCDDRVGRT